MKRNKILFWFLCITAIALLANCTASRQSQAPGQRFEIDKLRATADSIIISYIGSGIFESKFTLDTNLTFVYTDSTTFKFEKKSNHFVGFEKHIGHVQFLYSYTLIDERYSIFIPVDINANHKLRKNDSIALIQRLKCIEFIDENRYFENIPQIEKLSKENGIRTISQLDVIEKDGNFFWVVRSKYKRYILVVQIDNMVNLTRLGRPDER